MKALHRPQQQASQLGDETKISYLNSYDHETNETNISHGEKVGQLRTRPASSPRIAPNCPQKPSSQLGRETNNPYLDSYDHETNETNISYEKSVSSYDFGLIPICKRPQTCPQTIFAQLRHETGNSYLNTYDHETSKTASTTHRPRNMQHPDTMELQTSPIPLRKPCL